MVSMTPHEGHLMRLLDRFRNRAQTLPAGSQSAPIQELGQSQVAARTAQTRDVRPWAGPLSPHDVPSTWMQLPALRSAGWLVDVVGESFYQDAIEAVCGG